jgi:L-ribulose-5-phosphate 3-epimerase
MQPGIRIGVTAWSLDGDGPETVHGAAALGFESVHISSGALDGPFRLDDDRVREEYRRASADTGVRIDAISPGDLNDLGMTSGPGTPAAARVGQTIRIAIEAAIDLAVPLVFLPSFRAGEIRTDEDLRRTADVLAEACDLAAGRLTIATENTLGSADNRRLLEASGRPDLRILLDTQNPALWGHPVAPLVEELWPSLTDQVHVKDGVDGEMGDAPLGAGDSGFDDTAAVLRRRGFSGALISENDYHGERSVLAARDFGTLTSMFGERGG